MLATLWKTQQSFHSNYKHWHQPAGKCIQLFRQKLSHKSVKAYVKMPISIMGRKSLALIDLGSRCLPTRIEKA